MPIAATLDGDGFFFHTYETEGDWQLWSTDGTEAGTQLLADLSAAPYSDDSPSWSIIAASDAYYFHVRTLASSYELWRSDGTPTGTYRLLAPENGVEFGAVSNFTEVGDVAYFTRLTAWDGALSLWRTDGSADGTVRVGDIQRKGGTWSGPELVNFNGTLYFTAAPTEGAYALAFWKVAADGAGVELALTLPSFWQAELYHPQVHQGSLYFQAYSPGEDDGVWRTDGTAAGTVRLKYIRNTLGLYLNSFTPVGESLYFSVNYSVVGYKRLWQTDGSEAGTVKVSPMLVESLFNADGVLFLQGTTGPIGSEAYVRRSDAGDYNADDRVDGADFLAWQRRAGAKTMRGGFGDGNRDGIVDSEDLDAWQVSFGVSSATPLAAGSAAVVPSELSVASLTAAEEISARAIGERFDDAGFNSAADAAFAWLAAGQTATDQGDWKRAPAVEVELLARDHAARSSFLGPSARNGLGGACKPGGSARRIRQAEVLRAAGDAMAAGRDILAPDLEDLGIGGASRAPMRR